MSKLGFALGLFALMVPGAASAQGDPVKGKTVFARCMACHQTVAGRNALGPTMAGVVGRKAGAVPRFNYSPAMKASGLIWTPSNLNAFLLKPTTTVKGTRMIFVGLPNSADRANLIAYLATLK